MARVHFNSSEDIILNRIIVLKDLIANQNIHETPCELLLMQLNEMNVLCSLLQKNISELSACTQRAVSDN